MCHKGTKGENMDTKHYDMLLAIVMDKLEKLEVDNNWLKYENQQLKEQLNNNH